MAIDFSNKSQLGALGEFVYKKHCESLGFHIERTNYCHTDFTLKADGKSPSQYIDVKSTLSDKKEYQGKRYHKDISYELLLFLGDEIILSPDKNSPLYDKGRRSLGSISEWLVKWEQNTEIVRKRESRLDSLDLNNLKELFSKTDFARIRIIERGDASGTRWTGTVDNLPGSPKVINSYDATIFIEFGCKDFIEKVSKTYLIFHHFLDKKKIKMSKPSTRQAKKGIEEVIDLQAFLSDYPELVFDNIDALKFYVKKTLL